MILAAHGIVSGLFQGAARAATIVVSGAQGMQRRQFIGFSAGLAATWPLAAVAQQATAVIGYLGSTAANRLAKPPSGAGSPGVRTRSS